MIRYPAALDRRFSLARRAVNSRDLSRVVWALGLKPALPAGASPAAVVAALCLLCAAATPAYFGLPRSKSARAFLR